MLQIYAKHLLLAMGEESQDGRSVRLPGSPVNYGSFSVTCFLYSCDPKGILYMRLDTSFYR